MGPPRTADPYKVDQIFRRGSIEADFVSLERSPRARIWRVHVLDNPVWHTLTGPHAALAERAGDAARYLPDVAVFGALPDDATPAAWDDLHALVGAGGAAFLARGAIELPDGWRVEVSIPCRQMVLPDTVEPGVDDALDLLRVLADDDVPEMLALVEKTRPGPFARRTIELGHYLGIRDDGVLVAMAGERMHPAGYTEISGVCTDADHRGRGLASRLVRALVRGIRVRGETPFLHLTKENDNAHRVYDSLGFETRTFLDVQGVRAP
jgi:ribosomal protein S18 acetylase RimI-like enzyme